MTVDYSAPCEHHDKHGTRLSCAEYEKQHADAGKLTYTDANYLADLLRGVQAHARLRYWPLGTDTTEPVSTILRAFTYSNGMFPSTEDDIRDTFVWTSGLTEHWYPVRELVAALRNAAHVYDTEAPMAAIEYRD